MDLKDALIHAGSKTCGYMNCKLFVQSVTGVSRLQDLPSRPFHSQQGLATGDVLRWGGGLHYAIYLGGGQVMEVEEWGVPMRIVSFSELLGEMDPPDTVLSTTQRGRARRNPRKHPHRKRRPRNVVHEQHIEEGGAGAGYHTPRKPRPSAQRKKGGKQDWRRDVQENPDTHRNRYDTHLPPGGDYPRYLSFFWAVGVPPDVLHQPHIMVAEQLLELRGVSRPSAAWKTMMSTYYGREEGRDHLGPRWSGDRLLVDPWGLAHEVYEHARSLYTPPPEETVPGDESGKLDD